MALVLALREQEDLYVGDDRVVVASITSPAEFVLKRMSDGQLLTVTEGESVPLFTGVRVSVGARSQFGIARVAIEAPRSVAILRGENYRRVLR